MGKTKKKMEKEQQELEERRALRKKQIAQLKASNEMLEEAKKSIIEHYGEGSDSAKEYLKQIDLAKGENFERAATYLNASQDEVNGMEYNKVNKVEAEKYYERLKKLGKSEEELYRKAIVDADDLKQEKPSGKSKVSELLSKLDKVRGMRKTDSEPEKAVTEPVYSDASTVSVSEPDDMPDTTQKEADGEPSVDLPELPNVRELHSIEEYTSEITNERPYRCEGFDPRDVPDYVQYDIIPLPSKGECYPHKKNCLPVAYLTAADENIIASPNIYNNGNLMDILLERKILDKSVRVADLTKGDRDAIIVWLRATAYGPEYPIVARYEGKEFETTVDLSKLKFKPFGLVGDENGYFDYVTDSGDRLKFKFLTADEENNLFLANKLNYTILNTKDVVDFCTRMLVPIRAIDDNNTNDIVEAVEGIQKWASDIASKHTEINDDLVYNNVVTSRMAAFTMSVNGNTDRVFIKNYIENMRSYEARKYREYVNENTPCMDFNVEIEIPESMGGGSFTTFLRLGESIFFNVL